ncbi:hypothetical protein [Serinicoccus marinus]|uniref:hypothetical protein n=1 Tax=Serinicoccus marinus TaxID=247333 RepID=UPI00122E762A|nr:hypothetical protein [Serinicoccus marinus]
MPKDYNVAARLSRSLNALLEHGRGQNTAAVTAWAEVCGLDWPHDKGELLRRGAQMILDADEIRRRVEALSEEDAQFTLRHFDQVEKTVANFTMLPQKNMQQFFASLDDAGLYGLDVCSRALAREDPEPSLSEDRRRDLRSQAQDLLDLLEEDEGMEPELHEWLLARTREIIHALDNYEFFGTRALQRAVDEYVGGVVNRRSFWTELKGTDAGTKVMLLLQACTFALSVWTGVGAPALESSPIQVIMMQEMGVDPARPALEQGPSPAGDSE